MPNLGRKGERGSKLRNSRPRKKKAPVNRFEAESSTSYVSTSAKKLKSAHYEDIEIDSSRSYVICNFLTVFTFLSECLVCKSCHKNVTFSRTSGAGIAFKLVVKCSCATRYVGSSPTIGNAYEVNRRFMIAMRILGNGLQSLKTFCGLMDISHSFSNNIYYAFLDMLQIATKSVFELIQKRSVEEEIKLNAENGNEARELSVSGDGSWKKRGFSSLFGIASLIGKYTGKVLDVLVKSSYCQECKNWKSKQGTEEYNEWLDSHEEKCSANHHGSAGKMEVDAMKEMFSRSEELLGVKYVNYIGDGDTKTFKALLDLDPYDVPVHKKECVGHVQKRMGNRLRALKKGTKRLGGKGAGKLTDKLIADLTTYYGLAIRRHPDSAAKMKDAIWATFYHKSSTDENPQHSKCPEGENSWCKWRVAEAKNELLSFKHDPPLQQNVQEAIKPVYEALSTDELLQRCTGGNTQNSNECFNSCIWKLAPKHLHCGSQTIQCATYIAANLFNEGYSSLLKTMTTMGIAVGLEAKHFASESDERRVQAAECSISSSARSALLAKKNEAIARKEQFEEEEGLMYGPGIAD